MNIRIKIKGTERICKIVEKDFIPKDRKPMGSFKPDNINNYYVVFKSDENEYFCYIDETKKAETTKIKLSGNMVKIDINTGEKIE